MEVKGLWLMRLDQTLAFPAIVVWTVINIVMEHSIENFM